jgi:hypothetical protein
MDILAHRHLSNPDSYDISCYRIMGVMKEQVASARVTCWSRTTCTELVGLLIDARTHEEDVQLIRKTHMQDSYIRKTGIKTDIAALQEPLLYHTTASPFENTPLAATQSPKSSYQHDEATPTPPSNPIRQHSHRLRATMALTETELAYMTKRWKEQLLKMLEKVPNGDYAVTHEWCKTGPPLVLMLKEAGVKVGINIRTSVEIRSALHP